MLLSLRYSDRSFLFAGSFLEPRGKVRGHRERTSAASYATDGRQHESTQPFRLQPVRSIRSLCTGTHSTSLQSLLQAELNLNTEAVD